MTKTADSLNAAATLSSFDFNRYSNRLSPQISAELAKAMQEVHARTRGYTDSERKEIASGIATIHENATALPGALIGSALFETYFGSDLVLLCHIIHLLFVADMPSLLRLFFVDASPPSGGGPLRG